MCKAHQHYNIVLYLWGKSQFERISKLPGRQEARDPWGLEFRKVTALALEQSGCKVSVILAFSSGST
jgi:hypothetical protein